MKKILPIIIILSLLLSSCGAKQDGESGKVKVYTTFYAMQGFAKAVAQDKADVVSIVPVGTEPHEFEPTAADIAKISKADMFIYHGAGMDDWAKDIAETLPKNVTVVCASEGIEQTGGDPHLWLGIKNAKKELETIYKNFLVADKDGTDTYLKNMTDYSARLDELGKEYEEASLSGKKLFVTHGAYGYLCADYGMEQVSLEGISGESDPSPAQMAEFVEKLHQSGAKAVFYDPLEGDKIANAAAKEAGIEALELYTFEGDSEGRDYITIMQQNLEQLKKGLN